MRWKCNSIKLSRTLAPRCRLGKGVGLSQESSIGWRSWDDWGESSQLLSTDFSRSFFPFFQIIAISLNMFPFFQMFPMLEILAKELCSNGPVQISVGIRVDRSIYQVKCETKVTNPHRWFKTTLFKVRGYKPAPVAWPKMSEEVDDLGKRMSRCQIFVYKVLDGRWSDICVR